MSNQNDSKEKSLQALLQGKLSDTDAQSVRSELEAEEQRAKVFMETYLQQNSLERSGIEKAPESLRRRIRAIPVQYERSGRSLLHLGAIATVVLSIIVGLLVYHGPAPDEPTPEEIDQARRELIIAFNYLEDIGQQTSNYMSREIGGAMEHALIKGIVHGISEEPKNG